MRDFKNMKRQRGRNRGSSNGGGNNNNGGKQQHNVNRAFDSNGPDGVKVRGHAQAVFEKYQQLARDSSAAGDRVLAENYLQHAEHYFRLLRAVQPQRPTSEILGRDGFATGYDIDFEDESGAQSAGPDGDGPDNGDGDGEEPRGEYRDTRQNDNRQNETRSDNYRQNDNRQNDNRQGEARQAEPRADNPRQDQPRETRQAWNRDRDRDNNRRNDRNRDEPRAERTDPLPVVEPESTPLTAERPADDGQPQLRSQDGALSPAPAFLQVRATEPRGEAPDEAAPAKRPRRRRAPAGFQGDDGAPPPAEREDA